MKTSTHIIRWAYRSISGLACKIESSTHGYMMHSYLDVSYRDQWKNSEYGTYRKGYAYDALDNQSYAIEIRIDGCNILYQSLCLGRA